jgi:dihydropyrimidinase
MAFYCTDYTPYEGTAVTNWPRYTILRGAVAWDRANGGILSPKGSGQYIKRIRSDMTAGVEQTESFLDRIDRTGK